MSPEKKQKQQQQKNRHEQERKKHKYAGKKGKEKITTMNTKKAVKTFAWIFYTHTN